LCEYIGFLLVNQLFVRRYIPYVAILLFNYLRGLIMIYMDLFIISGLLVTIFVSGILYIRAKYLGY